MAITCCKNCVPPQRHPGCHSTCKQYLKEKAEYEKQKEYAKAHKTVMLTNYDFDEIAYVSSKRHKRRSRD
jgi:hypothetical protein